MPMVLRSRPWLPYGAAVTLLALGVFALPALSEALLRPRGYAPHGVCILWEPGLLWMHVTTDVLIGSAYVVIAVTLAYLVYRARRNLPFHWVLLAFGAFIISCGSTHFMEAWTFWSPLYWLSGATKVVTAVASVATAIALPPLVPRVVGLVEAAQLSTEHKRQLEAANAELRQLNLRLKELDELKSQLFANVSHELRTPLTLILGPAELLLATAGAEQRPALETIQRNARLLQRNVDDLLDIARLDAGQLELRPSPLDLADLARRTAANFAVAAAERRVELRVQAPEALPIEADEAQLQRVLVNLLGNALKFTPEGGAIRLTARGEGPSVALEVDDSGPGVPPALREAVFERFRQGDGGDARRHGGIGLGLAIVREVVALHGGAVAVGDSPLGGARFTVTLPAGHTGPDAPAPPPAAVAPPTLPAEAPPAPAAAPAAEAAPPAGERPLLLLVEDNAELRRFLGQALAPDYRLAYAADGDEGLASAEALRPDLIVTDVMLPGMSGEELLAALRGREGLGEVPVLALTARSDLDLRVRLLRGGAQDYLMKPFALAELQARVANLLAAARARAVLRDALASREHDLAALSGEIAGLYRQAQEALHLRDEFAIIAAHELRTPVTALMGNAQLLARRWEQGGVDQARDMRSVRAIGQISGRLAALIEALVDINHIEREGLALVMGPLDLGELVRAQVEQLAPTLDQHQLALQAPARPLPVVGDAGRLEQVVANLLGNAVKYSPEGGPIAVVVAERLGEICVTVSDRGIGVPAEALPHLFERFYRAPNVGARSISGFGIGLFLAREIIERHGGTIGAQSAAGRGTSITFCLPRRV